MRWLRFQGRHAEVIDILKKAAKVNKKTLPAELELEPLPKADVDEKKHGVLDLFRPLKMFRFSAAQGFAWFVFPVFFCDTFSKCDGMPLRGLSSPVLLFIFYITYMFPFRTF